MGSVECDIYIRVVFVCVCEREMVSGVIGRVAHSRVPARRRTPTYGTHEMMNERTNLCSCMRERESVCVCVVNCVRVCE